MAACIALVNVFSQWVGSVGEKSFMVRRLSMLFCTMRYCVCGRAFSSEDVDVFAIVAIDLSNDCVTKAFTTHDVSSSSSTGNDLIVITMMSVMIDVRCMRVYVSDANVGPICRSQLAPPTLECAMISAILADSNSTKRTRNRIIRAGRDRVNDVLIS